VYLALDSDEQQLADAAAGFLGGEFPLQRLHAENRDADCLREFAQLGWLGLAAPEAVGGSGLGMVEEMLFCLELGRVAGPVSVLAQMLAVAAAAADSALRARLVAGAVAVGLVAEQAAGGEVRVIGERGTGYALAITPGAATLFEFDSAACRQLPCLDRSVTMLAGPAACLREHLRIDGDALWRRAQVDLAALLTGTAERALDMIVAYAKQRHTFGRPIGAYQAVRHPCADMALRVEAARCQLYYAATAVQEHHTDAAAQAEATRLLAARAARDNTDTNIQLHGGIGVTDEFSAHLLLKRANLLWRLFASPSYSTQSLLLDGAAEGG